MAKMIDIPPVWLFVFAVLAWWQPRVVAGGPDLSGPVAQMLGGLLVGAGLLLIGMAAVVFLRHKTTIIPHQQPNALITDGICRFTRNPIYLADALILTGLCLRFDAPWALLLVPVFVVLIDRRFIRAEEARLQAAFGGEFEAYASRVRRWV